MVSTDSAGGVIQYYVVVLVADSFHLFPEDILAPNAGKFKLHAGKQDIRSDNVADPAFLDSVGNIAVPLENIIDGVCVLVIYSERKAEISLRVKVYREDLLPHLCKSSAYRTAGGSLSNAALLICECNYLCHKTPPETVALCRNPALFRHHKGAQ